MDAHPNRYVTNDEGMPMLCTYVPDHAHRGVNATTRLPAGPMGSVPACSDCRANWARHAARLAEITAGARPASDTAAHRVRAWTDAMVCEQRTTYSISGLREPLMLDVATVRALADGVTALAQHEQLCASITMFLTHTDGEPRTLAPSRTPRPPLFTYDVLVLLDQHEESTDGEDDGSRCPNGNRPPECTEIDPCEACTQDADAEAAAIEASMGLPRGPLTVNAPTPWTSSK
ncbi:hypothetical protein ACIP4Y_35650 [Streptomyces sp. NPDC088810]|uniref:hypothetical protein n=1 Tax=Streptomyces sp. NPDC088810 TaxID=3365904 RepID=UPI00380AF447